MEKLKTINLEEPIIVHDYELPKTPDSEYVVDDSNFVPIKEAIKQLNRIADPSIDDIAHSYDFPNGKDNGKAIPVTRTHNFGDIAELAVDINQQTEKMCKEIMKGKKEIAYQESVAEKIKAAKAANIEPGSSSE